MGCAHHVVSYKEEDFQAEKRKRRRRRKED